MRLIDADAQKEQFEWLGAENKVLTIPAILDCITAAPTVCCEECNRLGGDRPCLILDYAIADPRHFGCALFERRQG